jgi:hypothetical protein
MLNLLVIIYEKDTIVIKVLRRIVFETIKICIFIVNIKLQLIYLFS